MQRQYNHTSRGADSSNDYSPAVKDYIKSFNDKEMNTAKLKNLQLSDQEEALLEEYLDPITANVINIPVMLNERLYDLDTLLEIYKKNKLDPFNKYEFTLRDIQPNRKAAESLKKIVQQIKDNHQTNLLPDNIDQSNKSSGIFINNEGTYIDNKKVKPDINGKIQTKNFTINTTGNGPLFSGVIDKPVTVNQSFVGFNFSGKSVEEIMRELNKSTSPSPKPKK